MTGGMAGEPQPGDIVMTSLRQHIETEIVVDFITTHIELMKNSSFSSIVRHSYLKPLQRPPLA